MKPIDLDALGPFTVYELIDPRDGLPFYVGCGTLARAFGSGSIGASRGQVAKCERIAAILHAGLKPRTRLVATCQTKKDALEWEAAHYDLLSLMKGVHLTNKIIPKWGRKPPKFSVQSIAKQKKKSSIEKRRLAVEKRRRTIERYSTRPKLITWCGEASDYLVPCPDLPVYCVPVIPRE